jgi:hypothetical protein
MVTNEELWKKDRTMTSKTRNMKEGDKGGWSCSEKIRRESIARQDILEPPREMSRTTCRRELGMKMKETEKRHGNSWRGLSWTGQLGRI